MVFKKNPLKEKYKGMKITDMAIGYIDPITKKPVWDQEMLQVPKIKKLMEKAGTYPKK